MLNILELVVAKCSKNIFFIVSKFHEKTASHSGDIKNFCPKKVLIVLTHSFPLHLFHAARKDQEINGFPIFSGFMKENH